MFYSSFRFVSFLFHCAKAEWNDHIFSKRYIRFSNSLIIHKFTKLRQRKIASVTVWKCDQTLTQISQSFFFVFPKIRICLRSCIKHSQLYQTLALVSDTYTTYLYLPFLTFVKRLGCASFFKFRSRCLKTLFKHSCKRLIHYFKTLDHHTIS